jgi:hypothetical protein
MDSIESIDQQLSTTPNHSSGSSQASHKVNNGTLQSDKAIDKWLMEKFREEMRLKETMQPRHALPQHDTLIAANSFYSLPRKPKPSPHNNY